MDPQTELTGRYSSRDFSSVFAFLASVPLLAEGTLGTQVHHICPKKQYPQFANLKLFPENGVVLSLADHVYVHLLLELCEPELRSPPTTYFEVQKYAAAKGGSSSSREHHVSAGRKGGRKGGIAAQVTHKKNGTGPYAKDHQRRAGIAGGKVQGMIQGRKNVENSTGFCAPGVAARGGRMGGAKGAHIRHHLMRSIVNPNCNLCKKNQE